MNRLEIKTKWYVRTMNRAITSFLLIFLYWVLNTQIPPPSGGVGNGIKPPSQVGIYFNIFFFIGYAITSFYLTFVDFEKFIEPGSNKFPLRKTELLWRLSGVGIVITAPYVTFPYDEWNIIEMVQMAVFFILGCIQIIWVIRNAKRDGISLRIILKKTMGPI